MNYGRRLSCIKCENYVVCKNTVQPESSNHLCMACGDWFSGSYGWNKLEIREKREVCLACSEVSNNHVKSPTKCGHWVCVSCFRDKLLLDDTHSYLSPVPYGCPECPNCKNPVKGRQCHCGEYSEIVEKWGLKNPRDHDRWNYDEFMSIEKSIAEECEDGESRCPLCHMEYKKLRTNI